MSKIYKGAVIYNTGYRGGRIFKTNGKAQYRMKRRKRKNKVKTAKDRAAHLPNSSRSFLHRISSNCEEVSQKAEKGGF